MRTRSIVCPNCGGEIQLDTSTYDSLTSQIKDQVIADAVSRKEIEMQEKMQSAVQVTQSQAELRIRDAVAQKEGEIAELKGTLDSYKQRANEFALKQKAKYEAVVAQENSEKAALRKQIEMQEQAKASAVAQAIADEKDKARQKDAEIADLRQKIAVMQEQENGKIGRVVAEERQKASDKDAQIALLNAQIEAEKRQKDIQIRSAVAEYEKKEAELREKVSATEMAKVESETALKDKYEALLKAKEDELEHYKDYKSRMSVKEIGESLEQWAVNKYAVIRPLLPNATFEKDNEIIGGSKGDFVFREEFEGVEFISIMMDMKDEADKSTYRHTNESFLKKLDMDRRNKNCEYALLVSTLEDEEGSVFNQGIVDESHLYPKMFVVRPQFLFVLIMVLREAAMNTIRYRKEIKQLKEENIDVTNFEGKLEDFKNSFARSLELSVKKKDNAVDMIDKAIASLQKAKTELESFSKHMVEAENKSESLTVRKLTRNAPTVAALIADAEKEDKEVIEIPADKGKEAGNESVKKAV